MLGVKVSFGYVVLAGLTLTWISDQIIDKSLFWQDESEYYRWRVFRAFIDD